MEQRAPRRSLEKDLVIGSERVVEVVRRRVVVGSLVVVEVAIRNMCSDSEMLRPERRPSSTRCPYSYVLKACLLLEVAF